jgi:diguanylate cyclase (GGDEF)-like protein
MKANQLAASHGGSIMNNIEAVVHHPNGIPTVEELSPLNVRLVRARRGMKVSLIFLAVFSAVQIFSFTFLGNPKVLNWDAGVLSIGMNIAMFLLLGAFGLFNFTLVPRIGWDQHRSYFASAHVLAAGLTLLILGHIHIAGSSSSLLPLMLITLALLVSWLLGERQAWAYFAMGTLGLVALFVLERQGILAYMPLSGQSHRVPLDVFLELRYLGIILALFLANGAVALSLLMNFQRNLQTRNEQLIRVQEQLRLLATTDSLTELLNRRSAFEKLEAELTRAERDQTSMIIALVDLDHFKDINDTYGHPFGDKVLKKTAEALNSHFRPYDVVARFGGEEFLVASFNTNADNGAQLLDRVRKSIEHVSILTQNENPVNVTASFGYAVFDPEAPVGLAALLSQADQALYQSKKAGRNRVTFFGEQIAENADQTIKLQLIEEQSTA